MSNPATRADGRRADQLRAISFEPNIAPYATGSVLVSFGQTRVICGATIEGNVPTWMKQQKVPGGWLTAAQPEQILRPETAQEYSFRFLMNSLLRWLMGQK